MNLRFVAAAVALMAGTPCFAGLSLVTCCSGLNISSIFSAFSANLGSVNGLGLGTPSAGVSIYSTGSGKLYSSPLNTSISTNGGLFASQVQVSVKVSTDFVHSSVLDAYWCSTTCGSGGTAIGTSYGVIGSYTPGLGQTVQLAFGVHVLTTNGASAFTGSDSVVITLLCQDTNGLFPGSTTITLTLSLNVQNAVQLTLGTSGAGLTISAASDFTANWGNLNGLGVGTPSSGLTARSATGGFVYETPYSLAPSFSSFTSTTGTLSAYVSSNFAHSAIESMRDASVAGGPYTTISLSSATPSTFTSSATNGSTVTRYLGVYVANTNGGSAFTGADNATLTYQLTVP